MPKMVVTHAVVEVERWLQGKDERAAIIGQYATDVTDHVAADGSNSVAITADIHDLDGLQKLRANFDQRHAKVSEMMKSNVVDASTLLAMQVEVVNYTMMIDLTSKLTGKSTQSFDTLMKGQ